MVRTIEGCAIDQALNTRRSSQRHRAATSPRFSSFSGASFNPQQSPEDRCLRASLAAPLSAAIGGMKRCFGQVMAS
jgi:hypothetical protein